jgi:hypothetical protein
MKYFVIWISIFILVYLFYLFFIILRKNKLQLFKNNSYLKYLIYVYHLDIKKLSMKQMANIIGLSNAFILATTCTIVSILDNFFYQMVLAFAILILLQLFTYHVIGKILQRRDKNV